MEALSFFRNWYVTFYLSFLLVHYCRLSTTFQYLKKNPAFGILSYNLMQIVTLKILILYTCHIFHILSHSELNSKIISKKYYRIFLHTPNLLLNCIAAIFSLILCPFFCISPFVLLNQLQIFIKIYISIVTKNNVGLQHING